MNKDKVKLLEKLAEILKICFDIQDEDFFTENHKAIRDLILNLKEDTCEVFEIINCFENIYNICNIEMKKQYCDGSFIFIQELILKVLHR